jgi:hypothetical protein
VPKMSFQIDKVIYLGGPSPWQRSHFRLTRLVADQEVVFCANKRQRSGMLNPAIAVYSTHRATRRIRR